MIIISTQTQYSIFISLSETFPFVLPSWLQILAKRNVEPVLHPLHVQSPRPMSAPAEIPQNAVQPNTSLVPSQSQIITTVSPQPILLTTSPSTPNIVFQNPGSIDLNPPSPRRGYERSYSISTQFYKNSLRISKLLSILHFFSTQI